MLTDKEMKNAKPLILNTQMVKAILDGRKTRFSKVVKKPIDFEVESTNVINAKDGGIAEVELVNFDLDETLFVKPQYKVGDVLYVKESFALETMTFTEDDECIWHDEPIVHYRADGEDIQWVDDYEEPINTPYKAPMRMPKKYARIFLKITDSRFENLQDISVDSSVREGYCNKNIVNEFDYNDHLSRFHNKQWANFVGQVIKKQHIMMKFISFFMQKIKL